MVRKNMNNVYGNNCLLKSPNPESIGLPLNTKIKSDGLTLLHKIPNGSIPCVFFDPQYRGILDSLSYGNEGERQKRRCVLPQMTENTIKEFILQINRVLIPSGHLFFWVDKFHLIEGIHDWLKNTELKIVDHIVWNKMRMGMGYRTRRISEHLIILQKKPIKAKGVWSIHNIPDVWNEKVKTNGHVHRKPIGLQSKLIESVTRKGDVVLDPAAGSFSVLESALKTKRVFIGCDLVVE